jgi:mono/diheme cytochrome c family protein
MDIPSDARDSGARYKRSCVRWVGSEGSFRAFAAISVSGELWMRWAPLVALGALAFAVVGLFSLSRRIDLSAIQQPGRAAEYLRSKLTRAVIRRRTAREDIPPSPADRETSMSISAGMALYAVDCASCHGPDGRNPTPAGTGMLPRAVSLDSTNVQTYSDRELFSIIREGVRFTGMPGFAGAETNDHIWDLVDFVRSIQ